MVYCSATAIVSLDVCGIQPHLAYRKNANMLASACTFTYASMPHACADTLSFIAHLCGTRQALHFQCCQPYLSCSARNNIGGERMWHTCQIWQVWVGCEWEVETTAILKVEVWVVGVWRKHSDCNASSHTNKSRIWCRAVLDFTKNTICIKQHMPEKKEKLVHAHFISSRTSRYVLNESMGKYVTRHLIPTIRAKKIVVPRCHRPVTPSECIKSQTLWNTRDSNWRKLVLFQKTEKGVSWPVKRAKGKAY